MVPKDKLFAIKRFSTVCLFNKIKNGAKIAAQGSTFGSFGVLWAVLGGKSREVKRGKGEEGNATKKKMKGFPK